MFEKSRSNAPLRSICALSTALVLLSACSGGNSALPGVNALTNAPLVLKSTDFKFIVAWGSTGKQAVAQCPQGYKVVAGGSSSSDGSKVGTGFADSRGTSWIVKPQSGAAGESFATCIKKAGLGKLFHWRVGLPNNGLAAAQCQTNDELVTGYGNGGSVTDSWFDPSTNTYWVSGGGTAFASCVGKKAGLLVNHAWNKSQNPNAVFAGCGSGYTVIGGAMGNSAWPGPPIQQHPGTKAGPSHHGYDGWWTFSDAYNELTWAACVQT